MSFRFLLLVSLVLAGCIIISAQTSSTDSEAQTAQAATEPTTERDVPMSRAQLRELMDRERDRSLTPRELQQIRNILMREYEMAAMTSAMYARDLELLEPYLRETEADPDRVMLVEYDTAPDMMLMEEDDTSLLESDFEVSAPGYGGGYGGFGGKYGGFGGGYGGYGGFGGGFGGKKGKKIPPFKKVPYKKVPYKKVPYKKVPIKKGKKGGFGGYGGFGGGYGI